MQKNCKKNADFLQNTVLLVFTFCENLGPIQSGISCKNWIETFILNRVKTLLAKGGGLRGGAARMPLCGVMPSGIS